MEFDQDHYDWLCLVAIQATCIAMQQKVNLKLWVNYVNTVWWN